MILITGSNGQVGFDIVKEAKQLGLAFYASTRDTFDLTSKLDVERFFKNHKVSAVIHCAAYTQVDKAETDEETCMDVNVLGTQNLVFACKERQIPFLFLSTDYVFDGSKETPYEIEDEVNPIGVYARSKAMAESIVQNELNKFFIVRISWVFGVNGHNFVKTMLRLAQTHQEISVVDDQWGSPTYSKDLAPLLLKMIQTSNYGVFHATNEGFCTWAEFAETIFKFKNINVKVNKIDSTMYPTQAKRPKNSRLSKKSLSKFGFDVLPSWHDALQRYLIELENENEN